MAWAACGTPLAILGLAVVEFAAISSLLFFDHHVADAPLLLFVLPIALCAVRFEFWGGLAAGAVGLALVVGWDVIGYLSLGPIGYVARSVAFLALGGFLGALVAERRRLHERLDNYHDLSLDLLCTANLNGQFTRVNPAWERLLGHSPAELISRPFVEFVHPDDREQTEAETATLGDGTDTLNFTNRYRTSNGDYRWLEWNARAVTEEGLIYAAARDISEKKEAEQALLHHSELLESTVRQRTSELEEARLETLRRLALAAEYRDDDTHQHTERVGRTSALIAKQLGLPADTVALTQLAAPLHDIGKLAVSDSILLKPAKLTTEEFQLMQQHAQAGATLLSGSSSAILQLAEEIALTHHERWDGTGYPHGLRACPRRRSEFHRAAQLSEIA